MEGADVKETNNTEIIVDDPKLQEKKGLTADNNQIVAEDADNKPNMDESETIVTETDKKKVVPDHDKTETIVTETDNKKVSPCNDETDIVTETYNKKVIPDNDSVMNDKTEISASAVIAEVDAGTRDDSAVPDEYLYTKREGFTSEIFKISVTNLPKKFGFAEFKKKLIQLNLKPVKLKLWKDVCFVTFRGYTFGFPIFHVGLNQQCSALVYFSTVRMNEEDRESALSTLNGYKWKGHELNVVTARPAADPLMRKRKQNEKGMSKDGKKAKMEDDGLSPSERLKNSVTPLWKLSYEEQLLKKQEEMVGFMKKYLKQIEKNCPDLKQQVWEWRKEFGGMPCELQKIKPSPETEGYRNKCEFTIGPGIDGQTNVVGFRFGQYSQGTVYVGSPEEVSFLSSTMKTVVTNFQAYLSRSKYREFNPENHTGHWRQLAVRTSRHGHIMVMVDFHPQNLAQEEIESEQNNIRQYFTEGERKTTGITSCYFRAHSEKMTGAPSDVPYKLIFGDECITERLLEMEFRISPNAFFQVNTGAAEVLYKQVADWCGTSTSSTVLDVCCGTGTIGLTVAKSVEKVVGIEMCSEAIQDAKINAERNGVANVAYHCAKAEDVMKDITRSVRLSTDVVAIVDPPRSGLHSSVVVAIRNCRSINRLVYVSCNVNGALNNFIDLVRPTSKRLKGSRFLPIKAVPVDLFPHTNHCELVILFEREATDDDSDSSI